MHTHYCTAIDCVYFFVGEGLLSKGSWAWRWQVSDGGHCGDWFFEMSSSRLLLSTASCLLGQYTSNDPVAALDCYRKSSRQEERAYTCIAQYNCLNKWLSLCLKQWVTFIKLTCTVVWKFSLSKEPENCNLTVNTNEILVFEIISFLVREREKKGDFSLSLSSGLQVKVVAMIKSYTPSGRPGMSPSLWLVRRRRGEDSSYLLRKC